MSYYKGVDPRGSSMTHWKYTRKERKNGKWKYFYDNAKDRLGFDERAQMIKEAGDYRRAREDAKYFNSKAYERAAGEHFSSKSKEAAQKVYEGVLKSSNIVVTTQRLEYEMARFKYSKTPIGKIENYVKGVKSKVNKFLNKFF